MTDANPATNPAHATRAIRANETLEALDAYEAAAKERGIATHELTLIAERRRELARAAR